MSFLSSKMGEKRVKICEERVAAKLGGRREEDILARTKATSPSQKIIIILGTR